MPPHDQSTLAFEQAERRLFTACGVKVASRRVRLADPPVAVRVLEAGDGPPLVLAHGSGMSASTWAPLMLEAHRLIAFDLPGFGLSDAFDYSGRPLRSHAVAQLTSLLDALGVEQAPIVIRPPNVATTRQSMARGVIGPRAAERAPEGFFEVVHEGMRQPGFRTAMLTHMQLAMRSARPRPENFLSETELQQLTVPALMIRGNEDPNGEPEIGRRACALVPDARLEIIPGRHAPFLDDPERCGSWIDDLIRHAGA